MKISRLVVPLIASIPFAPIFLGYLALIFGGSLIISEWSTDRMLFQQKQFFENLITSQENANNLKKLLNGFSSLADSSSIFNILGLALLLIGTVGIILGIFLIQYNKSAQEKFYKITTVMVFLSDTSLFIIFSTFFAISLIFISVAGQIAFQSEQTLFTIIVNLVQDDKMINKIIPLFNEFLRHTSFQYALNTFNSGYFTILGTTFLIILILKRIHSITSIALIDYLTFITSVSLMIWIIIFIATIGISSPTQIPNIELSSQFQK